MELTRSTHTLIRFDRPFNSWIQAPLHIDDLRPLACVACAHPRGLPGSLGLHGHGVRARQQRGPQDPQAAPTVVNLRLRRFICTACRAVMTVAPPIVARKLFSAFAIGWALALYGLLAMPPVQVRARINPWRIHGAGAAQTWRSLTRWACEAHDLFAGPPPAANGDLRQRAQRASMALAARAGPSTRDRPLDHRAAIGATQPR